MQNQKKYSNLRATLAIAKASFTSIIRSPSAVIFSLMFPLVFIVVFGFVGEGGIKVKVGIHEGCDRENPIFMALKQIKVVKLIEDNNSNLISNLEKGRIDAIINISKNPYSKSPLYIIYLSTTKASPEKGNIFKSILNNISYVINNRSATVTPIVSLDETVVEGRQYKMIDFILPGQLGFSLLSSGVFGTAFVFVSLRITLVIKRFFATPIKRSSIILGEALSRLSFSLIGALIIILIGHYLFGFTLLKGVTTVLNMLVLSTIGLIIFMGFGFSISGIAKNESTVPPVANIVTLPQFLLSGTFFPIDAFPSWLQPISKALPLTYLNDAMRKVAFEGLGLFDVSKELLILGIWGLIIYAVAVKTFKWE